jgi:hypothetical protein
LCSYIFKGEDWQLSANNHLEFIKFPASLTEFEIYAIGFLKTDAMYFYNPTPPTGDSYSSVYYTECQTIYVPAGAKSDYEAWVDSAGLWVGNLPEVIEMDA